MGKKGQLGIFQTNVIIIIVVLILTATLFYINSNFVNVAEESLGAEGVDNLLANVNITSTLSFNPTGLVVTARNDTWLSFDGINDLLYFPVNSNATYSFWYKNATETNWQHIVNTSNILYWNGTEVAALPLNPLYKNDSDYVFGKTDAATFNAVDIDDIRIYNATINETIVDEVYANGRV